MEFKKFIYMFIPSSIKNFRSKLLHNYEVKNAGWIILGKIVQMLISFFVSVLVTRYLGPEKYGTINYIAAYALFFTSLCTLGINSIIVKEFVDHPDEQGKIIGTALVLRFISSLLSFITILFIVFMLDRDNPEMFCVAFLYCISLFFQIADTFNYWFLSKYLSKVCTIATLLAYIITTIYKLILVKSNKSIGWFAFAVSLDYICISFFLFFSYIKYNGQRLLFSWIKGKELLKLSSPYILSGMMVAIYGQTDKFMLKQLMNESEVGYYALASTITNMWVFVLAAIISSMTPTICHLYNTSKLEFDKKNRQLYAIIFFLSLFVAIGFTLLGRPFIHIVYGKDFLNAASPLSIICWYTAFSYLGIARNSWIVCNKLQKYLIIITGGAAIVNVVLNLLLIPLGGASGAALASLISQIATILFPVFIKDLRPNLKLMINAVLLRGIK